MHIEVGKTYVCKDLFKNSDSAKQSFYYVKGHYDVKAYVKLFKDYKKLHASEYMEVYGFKNLTNPKMEYHFNYLVRVEAPKKMLQALFTDFMYMNGINSVPYNSRNILVPENNTEALHDEMQCDLFLPGIDMKPETREHFGDIISNL
jgi:hypothetical protein